MLKAIIILFICSLVMISIIAGQTIRNPKLGTADLEAARAVVRDAAGRAAELVYATRIDAVIKGKFDSLIVVWAVGKGRTKEYFALVTRGEHKYKLTSEMSGRALPLGDRFLRIGLRHEDGKAPVIRLMSATQDDGLIEEQQRNLDYQFNGAEFVLLGQSLTSLPQ